MNLPKIAFVTGATSGFGAAIARRLLAEGVRVVATGRRRDRLEALAAASSPDRLLTIPLDVRDGDAVRTAVRDLPDTHAGVDLLVNNAGLALGVGRAPDTSLEDWHTMIDTNVTGLVNVTEAILAGMVARGTGHVVNVGSTAATYPYPGSNVYGATKAFVKQFSVNLRADLVGTPIRVTDVAPGLSESEFSVVRLKGDREAAAAVYAGTKPLTPEDVADTVLWVASRPAHVNVNRVELMPVCQAFGPFAIHREP